MTDAVVVFGVVGAILTISALASGIVERSPLSFPLMFLGLGLALGGGGLGALEIGPHDQILEVVATLTLALVLFLDAAKLQVAELGRRWSSSWAPYRWRYWLASTGRWPSSAGRCWRRRTRSSSGRSCGTPGFPARYARR